MSSDVFVRSLNRAWVGFSARLELFADEAPPGAPRRSVMGRTILRAIVAPRTRKNSLAFHASEALALRLHLQQFVGHCSEADRNVVLIVLCLAIELSIAH